jgi:hypothetical protein
VPPRAAAKAKEQQARAENEAEVGDAGDVNSKDVSVMYLVMRERVAKMEARVDERLNQVRAEYASRPKNMKPDTRVWQVEKMLCSTLLPLAKSMEQLVQQNVDQVPPSLHMLMLLVVQGNTGVGLTMDRRPPREPLKKAWRAWAAPGMQGRLWLQSRSRAAVFKNCAPCDAGLLAGYEKHSEVRFYRSSFGQRARCECILCAPRSVCAPRLFNGRHCLELKSTAILRSSLGVLCLPFLISNICNCSG